MYVLNTLQVYFWYTKLLYLKSAKLKQQFFWLLLFTCAEVQLKIYRSIFDLAEVELLQVYFRYTLNTLYLKIDTVIIQSSSIVILKHIIILRNVHCSIKKCS